MKCDPHHERCAELEAVNAELLAALTEMMREYEPPIDIEPSDAIILTRAAIKRAKEMNK